MNYRRFGRTNWQVSEIGYGMWGMGGWKNSDDNESRGSLQTAVDNGCNFFDTAWGYGAGHSEGLLGELVRNNPGHKLYTATKIPPKNFKWPSRREFSLEDCFPPSHIEEYVHSSLRNAGLESFDLMQFHTWEDSWLEDDRWVDKVEELKSQGLFQAIGISINRWEPWNGIKAVESGLIDAVQVIYNIFDQNPEDALFPACRKHDVGIIARVPFDEGTLSGVVNRDSTWPEGDWRNTYFVPENLEASVSRAEKVFEIIPEGMGKGEFALRFILSNPDVGTIIPGMRKQKHVLENCATSDGKGLHPNLVEALRTHRWERQPTDWSQ